MDSSNRMIGSGISINESQIELSPNRLEAKRQSSRTNMMTPGSGGGSQRSIQTCRLEEMHRPKIDKEAFQRMHNKLGSETHAKNTQRESSERGSVNIDTGRSGEGAKCSICMENDANAVVMECGHGGICFECALVILDSTAVCHFCREVLLLLDIYIYICIYIYIYTIPL